MPTHWAVDLGTSNTTICEDRSGSPHIVNLPELVKLEPVTQTPVVMSCVCILDPEASRVLIGQEAINYNWDGKATGFARGFKRYLGSESQRPMAVAGGRTFSAKDVTRLFLRELIRALEASLGEEVTDLTIATPCGSYETYRAELQGIVRELGRPSWWKRFWARVRGRRTGITFRTLDEPVAAALGYGVDIGRDAIIVALDFGAGSLETAGVRTSRAETIETGQAEVLAKQGLQLGGDDVDRWIVESFVPETVREWPEHDVPLLWEAERVKLLASAGSVGSFAFQNETYGTLDYQGLSTLLAERGLYVKVEEMLDRLIVELRTRHGLDAEEIQEVILEGGSTLLPEVRNVVGEVLGRHKVREWLPFESVARGACIFAAGAYVEDFVYHDYALRVKPDEEGEVEYELLIPGGTRYPTPADFATRYYAPGHDGQGSINLFICEVGRVAGQPVEWHDRPNETRYFVPRTEGERAFCICLNEAEPALPLNPPGQGTSPRLRVTYSVDANRWLCVTVHDLQRKTDLRVEHPVVRLR